MSTSQQGNATMKCVIHEHCGCQHHWSQNPQRKEHRFNCPHKPCMNIAVQSRNAQVGCALPYVCALWHAIARLKLSKGFVCTHPLGHLKKGTAHRLDPRSAPSRRLARSDPLVTNLRLGMNCPRELGSRKPGMGLIVLLVLDQKSMLIKDARARAWRAGCTRA